MKKLIIGSFSLILLLIITSKNLHSQNTTYYIYTFSVENSEILDYQSEQKVALAKLFRVKEAFYNEENNSFTVSINKLHNLPELKESIEQIGMKVIGEIKVDIEDSKTTIIE